jgi:crossover junction endodeoxyribonuclease RuvC
VIRCLGLDLSLAATGFADHAGTGLIRAPKGETGIERIETLAMAVTERARLSDMVIIEGHSFSSRQSFAHEIGELFGVVKYLLYISGTPIVEVPPASLKKYATGKGNAGKDEVIAAAIRSLGFPGSNNNEADAWVLYSMAKAWYEGEDGPAYRRLVLKGIKWPGVLGSRAKIAGEETA